MNKRFSPDFAVGVSALLGLLIMAYFSLEVDNSSSMGRKAHTYYSNFKSASGLVKKTPIEIAGIVVGFVDEITLAGDKARIKVRLRKDVKVYSDAVLHIKDRGVLGDKFVLLLPGTNTNPLVLEGGEINGADAGGGFEELSASLGEVSKTIKELLNSDNPKGALGETIVNIRETTHGLRDLIETNQIRINKILSNIESFSGNLNEITADNKEQIKTTLASIQDVAVALKTSLGKDGNVTKATEKLDQSMASVQKIVDKIERGEGTLGKIINDETTINNINETVESVNETLGLFRRIQLGIRFRGEYLTSSKQLQNLIGVTIAPTPDKYVLIEVVNSPVGYTSITNTSVNSGGTNISTTQTVQSDNKTTLTLLFAKRFLDFTLRFGMIRSTGGAGMDFHLFKDNLTFSFEGFNFNRFNNSAHYRAYGTLLLYRHVLLTGGVDDIFNKLGGKNAFFGAGIQFTEQDLKAMLPVAGAVN